ncbi:MAG: alpha/beta hydrolase [Leeuwenhoekiella sp.]
MKQAVYLMPGMAANPSIFENIALPEEDYELRWLHWQMPEKGESLSAYAKKMTALIKTEYPVLIGVSFGGILVQEMAKTIATRKVIIISSVKTKFELPRRMQFSRKLGLYRVAPTGLVRKLEQFAKYAFGEKIKHRIALYQKYLSVDDPIYLDWALENMLCWDQETPADGLVHIHGTADPVFPFKYINGCIPVKDGTHIMVITKYKWFNENLPKIIAINQ